MGVGKLVWRRLILATAVAGVAIATGFPAHAADPAKDPAAARYVAGRLVDDARQLLRNSNLPADIAAKQAAILLQYAQNLDGTDLRALKMLAEAARAAGKPAMRKDALRQLIGLDKGDLVAQVQYLDLLASASEMLDERARIYQNAMEQTGFDAQIRSEMAVRLAQIADERGDPESERQFIARALKLNDVNLGALRLQARMAAQNPRAVPEKMAALVSLLTADPFQPDAWMEMSRICAVANLHERAADYLVAAIEQLQLQGVQVSGEVYQELAIEEALAGRRAESFQIIGNLTKLPDAPLSAMLIAQILVNAEVPGSGAMKDQIGDQIGKLLGDMAKDAGGVEGSGAKPSMYADAAGVELSLMPTVSPETAKWIDSYAAAVAPEDPTLARLRAWQLYRAGKVEEARAAFEKVGGGDPMVQVGLARALIDQNKKDGAARQLQDIWSSHPTGLLALQVTETARRAGITLTDTQWTKQLRDVATKLPNTLATAHRSPRDLVLIDTNIRKSAVGLGEPVVMSVRITNVTDRAMPVGADAMVVTTVGVSAVTRAVPQVRLGVYAIEDLQRVYRVEGHGVIDGTIRLDQGSLSDMAEHNPTRTCAFGIKVMTAPRVDTLPGLGGLSVVPGDIQRGGLTLKSTADLELLTRDMSGTTGPADKQLVRIGVAGAILKYGKESGADSMEAQETTRAALIAALRPLAGDQNPLVRAAVVRAVPADGGAELNKAIEAMGTDTDPLVRILWAAREEAIAAKPDETGKAALGALQERETGEKDEMVKEWMQLAAGYAQIAATPPPPPPAPATTVPATAPATAPNP